MHQTTYRDQYRHLIAVDCVIFGYEDDELKLLLFRRVLEPSSGEWSLLGGWVNEKESVEDAAIRVLRNITGLKNVFMNQVGVFSDPDRDPGGHVMSVVFKALIDIKKHNADLVNELGASWWPIPKVPNLIFDHNAMLKMALSQLQHEASNNIIGLELLPEEFTIIQLRKLYNSIFQHKFDPGNFRKKILSLDVLERLEKKDFSESKKGAFYYKCKPGGAFQIKERIVALK